MLTFEKAQNAADPASLVPKALGWVMAAGNPYYDWLFGGRESATLILNKWMSRSSSEISILRVQFLLCDTEIGGGFIALSGRDLTMARKADAAALSASAIKRGQEGLAKRMAAAAGLFSPVDDDDYYLSKMGLAEPYRRKGLGRALVERYVEEGCALGHRTFCLDVHAENEPAIQCYRGAGFEISGHTETEGGTLEYYSMRYKQEGA